MKFFNSLLITAALISTSLVADIVVADASIEGGLGWRHDIFKGAPFKNIDSVAIDVRAEATLNNGIYGVVDANYAWLISDKKKASDTIEFTNLNNELVTDVLTAQAKLRGFAYGVTAAAGYDFCMLDGALSVTPLIGYTYQRFEQKIHLNLNSTGVLEELSTILPLSAKFKVRSEWYSPLVGVKTQYAFGCYDVFAELQYYPNFFQHHSFKNGFGAVVGAKYNINENWDAGVRVNYQNLDNSNWQTVAVVATAGYSF